MAKSLSPEQVIEQFKSWNAEAQVQLIKDLTEIIELKKQAAANELETLNKLKTGK